MLGTDRRGGWRSSAGGVQRRVQPPGDRGNGLRIGAADRSECETKTASGLYIETVAEGAGDPVAAGHTVTVTYTGLLASGITFDPGNAPLTFTLGTGQVVAGFDEGVTGMKLGGIRIVIIPPGLAYGERAIGAIPAGSILIFRIELTDIAG